MFHGLYVLRIFHDIILQTIAGIEATHNNEVDTGIETKLEDVDILVFQAVCYLLL